MVTLNIETINLQINQKIIFSTIGRRLDIPASQICLSSVSVFLLYLLELFWSLPIRTKAILRICSWEVFPVLTLLVNSHKLVQVKFCCERIRTAKDIM